MKYSFTPLLALILAFSAPVVAASLELANDPATGVPGKFAAEEIRREAKARGITLEEDAQATRIAFTVQREGSWSRRVTAFA